MFDNPLVEKIYQDGLIYIERIRKLNQWEDGVLVMPFICYGCEQKRMDLAMTTGDGLPMCLKCFDRISDSLQGILK